MKFLPIVDLWQPAINAAVRLGQIRLQPGQWVRCGDAKHPSRFIRASRYSIWAVHPQGQGKDRRVPREWFKLNLDAANGKRPCQT